MRPAENPNERDTLGPEITDNGSIEMGTVGWDSGAYLDQGSTGNDGNTLIAVQLYRGRDPSTPLKPGVAQGHQIWCQVSSMFGVYWLPPVGTRVLVAIPAGMRETQGAALIVGAYQTSPTVQFKPGRVMWDVGNATHLLLKGKSAAMQSYSSPAAQFVGVGVPMAGGAAGVYALDETGSGFSSQAGEVAIFATSGGDVKSTCHLTASSAEIINKGSQSCGVQATGGNCTAFGQNFNATCAGVNLGSTITNVLTNRALFGTPASPTPSTTVCISA